MNVDETTELDWNWSQWLFGTTRGSATVHYANLTRGVACAPKNSRLCRIQSTQCEAKTWDRVLLSVPDELIATVAMGQFVVVHDYSEKPRETRAMWQGLTLARIMMELRWFGELRSRYHLKRGGESNLQYLKNVVSHQESHVKRKYDYFRGLAMDTDTTRANVISCWSASGGRACDVGRGRAWNSPDRPPSSVW